MRIFPPDLWDPALEKKDEQRWQPQHSPALQGLTQPCLAQTWLQSNEQQGHSWMWGAPDAQNQQLLLSS